jgi:hypothetical protein
MPKSMNLTGISNSGEHTITKTAFLSSLQSWPSGIRREQQAKWVLDSGEPEKPESTPY